MSTLNCNHNCPLTHLRTMTQLVELKDVPCHQTLLLRQMLCSLYYGYTVHMSTLLTQDPEVWCSCYVLAKNMRYSIRLVVINNNLLFIRNDGVISPTPSSPATRAVWQQSPVIVAYALT